MGEMAERTRIFRVTVTSKPTLLSSYNAKRKLIMIYNVGTSTVYIVDSEARTVDDGIPLAGGDVYKNNTTLAALYALTSSGTADVIVEEDA